MNKQVTIEITAEVKVNGVLVPDAQVTFNEIVIDKIVLSSVVV